ncbi:hypothetical protein RIF29_47155 [Crotalaria pallida]|uniref:Uncharacterized protein n=1 Tax=Crotalaria pallida TaxID=3830 RepID=A0AAN9DTI2_CROPI
MSVGDPAVTYPSSGGTEDSMLSPSEPADVKEELPLWVGQLSTLRHTFDRLFTTSTDFRYYSPKKAIGRSETALS